VFIRNLGIYQEKRLEGRDKSRPDKEFFAVGQYLLKFDARFRRGIN